MRVCVASAAICLASPALAQPFVEISFNGVRQESNGNLASRMWGRAVFDAAAPPSSANEFFVFFAPLEAEGSETSTITGGTNAPFNEPPQAATASFLYDIGLNRWVLNVAFPGSSLSLRVSPPGPAFDPTMTSLPDDPADYDPDTTVSHSVILDTVNSVVWTSASGFTNGSFGYAVRIVDAPDACPADVDNNGILNFDDIDAFVAGFLDGCP